MVQRHQINEQQLIVWLAWMLLLRLLHHMLLVIVRATQCWQPLVSIAVCVKQHIQPEHMCAEGSNMTTAGCVRQLDNLPAVHVQRLQQHCVTASARSCRC